MLNELRMKIKSKESVQVKLNDLFSQKKDLEEKLRQQKKIVRKENDDVEKLEYGSLSTFFYEILGTKEQKLSKEKEEAYQAKLKYDSLEYQYNDVQKGITYFENELKAIEECESQYQDMYATKLDELKMNDPYLSQLEKDWIHSSNNVNELVEAIQAGESSLHTANRILIKLDNAKGWSQFDLIGGGGIADLAKYGHLDEAQRLMNELQAQLARFKTELLDVKINLDMKVEIDSFLKFADFWFDGIFSDFTVYERIKKAIVQITTTRDLISNLLEHLKDVYNNEQKNATQLKNKIDEVVHSK